MKKQIITLAITTLVAGTIFTACQTSGEKEKAAQEKVQDAKQDLTKVQTTVSADSLKIAQAADWKIFKNNSDAQIKNNDVRIGELKAKIKMHGKTNAALYNKKIDALELKNKDLKARLDVSTDGQSDWESFKREYTHDMDELGKSLKDFTIDNKK